jgi:hypothetical protein
VTRAVILSACCLALAACSAPTRDYAWYKSHPADAAKVAAGCGSSRSDDCANAEKAVADTASDRRLDTYRKAF